MPSLVIEDQRVLVELSLWERMAAMHGSFALTRSQLANVAIVERPLAALRGVRAPGVWIPSLVAYGTYRHRDGKDFVAVVGWRAALRMTLREGPFDVVMLSLANPSEALAQLGSALTRNP